MEVLGHSSSTSSVSFRNKKKEVRRLFDGVLEVIQEVPRVLKEDPGVFGPVVKSLLRIPRCTEEAVEVPEEVQVLQTVTKEDL